MTEMHLTPPMVEQKLKQLVTDLAKADMALARARDSEVDAKITLRTARNRALLSGNCPRVSRDGWTAAERDAWVEDQVEAEQAAYDALVVTRESAQDHLRVLIHQSEIVRSLGASVRQSWELAGSS